MRNRPGQYKPCLRPDAKDERAAQRRSRQDHDDGSGAQAFTQELSCILACNADDDRRPPDRERDQ
jgi:hypothetical protein